MSLALFNKLIPALFGSEEGEERVYKEQVQGALLVGMVLSLVLSAALMRETKQLVDQEQMKR